MHTGLQATSVKPPGWSLLGGCRRRRLLRGRPAALRRPRAWSWIPWLSLLPGSTESARSDRFGAFDVGQVLEEVARICQRPPLASRWAEGALRVLDRITWL